MSKWLPIETAPKNGSRILLVKCGFIVCIGWFDAERGKWIPFDAEDFQSDESFMEMADESNYDPSYWMPLPEPPTALVAPDPLESLGCARAEP